jgi:sugar/nucleoside kinase (ribokinase family)
MTFSAKALAIPYRALEWGKTGIIRRQEACVKQRRFRKIIGIDSAVTDYTVTLTKEEWEQTKAAFAKTRNGSTLNLDAEKSSLTNMWDRDQLWDDVAKTIFFREGQTPRSLPAINEDPAIFVPTPGGTLPNIFYNMRGVLLKHPCEMVMYGTGTDAVAEFPMDDGTKIRENVQYPLDNGMGRAQSLVINVQPGGQKHTFTSPGIFQLLMTDPQYQKQMQFDKDALLWITGSGLNRMGDPLKNAAEPLIRQWVTKHPGPLAYNLPTSYPNEALVAGNLHAISETMVERADFIFGNSVELYEHCFGVRPDEAALAKDKTALTLMWKKLQRDMSADAEAVITAGTHGAYLVTKHAVQHVPAPALTKPLIATNCAGDTTIGTYMGLRMHRADLSPAHCLKVALEMARIKVEESTGRIPPERYYSALGEALDAANVLTLAPRGNEPPDPYLDRIVKGAHNNHFAPKPPSTSAFRVSSPVLLEKVSPARTPAL